jgi:spermidine synthase
MVWFLSFFFVSGFCSILYEIVWLRLAMAQFGVTSAMVSIVISMFMAGLGLGSWASGYLIRKYESKLNFPVLRLYALTELLIGASAILVPYELGLGRSVLGNFSLASSATYYLASGTWVALTLIPWCACMGATMPIAMLAIRNSFPQEAARSFSYLYLANVFGAVAGAIVPLVLIEVAGFHGTLKVAAVLNVLLAAMAMALSLVVTYQKRTSHHERASRSVLSRTVFLDKKALPLLFATGCTSMGIEVVWIRQFTPYHGQVVYTFAAILGLYLAATFVGSQIYRRWSRKHEPQGQLLWVMLGLSAVLSVVTASPQFHLHALLRMMLGIAPFSALLGFVTPMLVDRCSGGDPQKAGTAYAVNVVGCIVGPLLSGFLLLPFISERWVAFAFALPWLIIGISSGTPLSVAGSKQKATWQPIFSYSLVLLSLGVVLLSRDYEGQFGHREVLRDHTATVIATGEGGQKQLLVNGEGMTYFTPNTKLMAHLPLAFLQHPPQKALVICFGMGTTYRSLLSWNISTTAVELVPSVPRMFSYYYSDGAQVMSSPLSHVVIDDGRRYLERTSELYDVITLDPPPPVEAAGSSLLYSKEFYAAVKRHLAAGGILQQWLPYGDAVVQSAMARALRESFAYVRVFRAVTGGARLHFLASNEPIPNRTPAELVQRMPAAAIQDLIEWGPQPTPELQLGAVLNTEFSLNQLIARSPGTPALQDDRPANEYFMVRSTPFLSRLLGPARVSTALLQKPLP